MKSSIENAIAETLTKVGGPVPTFIYDALTKNHYIELDERLIRIPAPIVISLNSADTTVVRQAIWDLRALVYRKTGIDMQHQKVKKAPSQEREVIEI